jgi:hypothetical protein
LEIPPGRSVGLAADRIPRALSAGLALEIHRGRLAALVAGRIRLGRLGALALDAATGSGCCVRRVAWRGIRHSRR